MNYPIAPPHELLKDREIAKSDALSANMTKNVKIKKPKIQMASAFKREFSLAFVGALAEAALLFSVCFISLIFNDLIIM